MSERVSKADRSKISEKIVRIISGSDRCDRDEFEGAIEIFFLHSRPPTIFKVPSMSDLPHASLVMTPFLILISGLELHP